MRGAVIAHFKHLKDLETSNVETQFVDKLINLTTLIFLLINQGNQHFLNHLLSDRINNLATSQTLAIAEAKAQGKDYQLKFRRT
jgi:hypothetical protein